MPKLSAAWVGRCLLGLFGSLLTLLVITFIIGRVMPVDPVGAIVGEQASAEAYAAMRARLGLDLPGWEQFLLYLRQLAHGDFGAALLTGNPVAQDLRTAFPATFELATLAIILSVAVGVPLGLAAAIYRDTVIDYLARIIALFGHSLPIFWFGIVGLIVFYARLDWVAGPGRIDSFYEGTVTPITGLLLIDSLLEGQTDIFFNAVSHGILPAVVLAYAAIAYITRMTRAFTLEQLGQDYVIAARAKGLRTWQVIVRHVLPNIAIQLVTILAISYGALLEGAVLVELVFSWPGIGQYMTNALMIGDMNAILACTLIIGLIFMLLNFAADVAYTLLDPRTLESAP